MSFVLNKDIFKKSIMVKSIIIKNQHIGNIKKELKNIIIKIPSVKSIVPCSKEEKLVLLMVDCPPQFVEKYQCIQKDFELKLDYSNFTVAQVLAKLLPKEMDIPSSYENVGHIAHLNLRNEQLPYKMAIGQIFLDKVSNIKTVVNKTNLLHSDNPFRILQFELLAGEENYIAKVSESNCNFEFDFSKVYWNSRLQMEHKRLTDLFKPSEYIADVFAGVGPFAVPAAKKCVVFANDLNPDSFHYLKLNGTKNKVNDRLYSYNLDGKDFIRTSLAFLNESKSLIEENLNKKNSKAKKARIQLKDDMLFDHYVLNLPTTALDFCIAFKHIWPLNCKLPMIHVYCFFKSKDQQQANSELVCRLNEALERPKDATFEELSIVDVRNVAPHKNMYCLSFRLPSDVGYNK